MSLGSQLLIITNNFSSSPNGLSQQPMTSKAEWAIGSDAMRARGIIVLIKFNQSVKNIQTKQLQVQLKLDFNHFLPPKSRRFSLLVDYNIQPSSSSTNQNAAFVINHQLDFTNIQFAAIVGTIFHILLFFFLLSFMAVFC